MSSQTKNILLTFLYFGGWAVIHTLTASLSFKHFIRRTIGKFSAFYTLFYILFSLITLGLFFLLVPEIKGLFYQIKAPFSHLLRFVQFLAAIFLFLSAKQFDIGEFLGFKDGLRFFSKEAPAEPTLVTAGIYGFVRHPLYFFAIIFMWANPIVTYRYLTIVSAFTLYFLIGSYFEEKKLVAQFGQSYLNYRKEVPAFLPLKWLKTLIQFGR